MTQIRGEQIKNLSITNAHIANNANIAQSKIDQDSAGWIGSGIVQVVSTDPTWDGSQSGELYYNDSTDELKLGTATDPYYELLMGGAGGWNTDLSIQTGADAADRNSTITNSTSFDANTTTASEVVAEVNDAITNGSADLSEYLEAYSVEDTDAGEIYIGIRVIQPTAGDVTITANGTLGWSAGTYDEGHLGTVDMTSGHDWSGANSESITIEFTYTSAGSEFNVSSSLEAQPDASNVEVFLNGALMENSATGDYTVTGSGTDYTVEFNYPIYDDDKVTIITNGSASLTNYTTKLYLQNKFGAMDTDIIPDSDESYDVGSSSAKFNNLYAAQGHITDVPNFASGTSQPSTPKEGDEFYNTSTGDYQKYLGGSWRTIGNYT